MRREDKISRVRQMMCKLAILGLWIGLAWEVPGTAPGEESPDADVADQSIAQPGDAGPDADSAARLGTILAAWRARASRLSSGEFAWRVVRRNQSADFGALRDSGGQPAGEGSSGDVIRISFNERAFRLDGLGIPTVGLSRRAAAARGAATGAAGEHEQFQAALRTRFARDPAASQESVSPMAYCIIADPEREVHVWEGTGASYPRALVVSPGGAQEVLGLDALSDIPLYSGLLDALCVAVRPGDPGSAGASPSRRLEGDWQTQSDRFRIVPDRPVVDGVPCAVIEERRGKNWEGEVRRTWVDTSRDCAVVRCLNLVQGKLDGPQYDIEYERDDQGDWLPRSIGVLRMSRLGDPLDEIVVVRLKRASVASIEEPADERHPDSLPAGASLRSSPGHAELTGSDQQVAANSEAFAWEPRPGAWVDDYREGRQYFVRRDGSRRTISFRENYAGLTYQELVAEDAGGKSLLGGSHSRIGRAVLATVVKAGSWPGILVTLPAGFGVWFGFKQGVRLWRRKM